MEGVSPTGQVRARNRLKVYSAEDRRRQRWKTAPASRQEHGPQRTCFALDPLSDSGDIKVLLNSNRLKI